MQQTLALPGRWLALLALSAIPALSQAQTTYKWTNGNGAISGQNNWTPVRSSPQNTDILVFDGSLSGGANPFVTVDAGFTAGQIQFINGTTTVLYANANRTITLNGSTGPDFVVSSNSKATFNAESKANLVVNLNGGATAEVSGTLIFNNTASAPGQRDSDHRLTGANGSIQFLTGSTFQQDEGANGGPFGANASTASFASGATFIQNSSTSTTPFGTNGDVTTFSPGSFYIYKAGGFATTGRTYGNLELQASASVTTGTLSIKNNLKVTSGTFTLGTGAALNVNIDGTAAQTISGAGALSFGNGTVLGINNAAGVTLSMPATVNGTLALTSGVLNTTSANPLIVGTNITGGSGSSYVNGPLGRRLAVTTANSALVFPLGSGTIYRPLTLTLTQSSTAATTYTAQQFEGRPSARTVTGEVQRVSYIRYFVLSSSGAATFTNGSIKLNFGADDQVDAAAKLRVARSSGSTWVSQGGTVTPNTNGTTYFAGDITSNVAFTQLGDFVLASTSADNGPGDNPLPVELTSFDAARQNNDVLLKWATASEKNNDHFEVQRSADGREFKTISSVRGNGSTTKETQYAYTDREALTGQSYYRLKQVDVEGTFSFSPVRVVADGVSMQAYPSPTSSRLNLPAVAVGKPFQVLNNLGQTLLQGNVPDNGALEVARLNSGTYILQIGEGKDRVIQRFVRCD